jgi:Asp-tRNA(Asn)/Glu-tRNA(Gln) amidotransferase A subunit family amidase
LGNRGLGGLESGSATRAVVGVHALVNPLRISGESTLQGSDLVYLSATEALARFRERRLSPLELLDALIERAERVEPIINAFADTYFDEAREQARQAADRYAGRGPAPRALEGIPRAVKDDTPIAGRRTTFGSVFLRDHVDRHSNPSVERLLAAGAILHARTTCPEFCWPWVCYSRLHGVTRNPWNPKNTPGGSSGGSAAALAAGTTTLAIGTDSGGSIRMPAAMCGVVGFKPPYGRNPECALTSFDVYNHIGPMTRSVQDSALMQNIMSGQHPADHASVRESVRIPETLEPVAGLRIAYSFDLGFHELSPDVRRNTQAALDALREAGASLVEVAIDWAAEATRLANHWGDHLHAPAFADAMEQHRDEVCDYTPGFAEQNARVSSRDFRSAVLGAGRIWRDHLGPLFEAHDVFVCPTVAVPDIPADLPSWEDYEVDGTPVPADGSWVMTMLFNMFSRCPVLAVPSGFTTSGMPSGIQIVGRPFDDVTVFRVAAALGRIRPWLDWSQQRPALG